ncbi:MAG: universal stress protein [Bdellovibrionota bacterium]
MKDKRTGIQFGELKRVIWAVDAFDEKSVVQRRVAQVARKLQSIANVTVEPVYVMTPTELNLSSEYSVPWIQHYRPAAERALFSLVKALGVKTQEKPKVLIQNFASTSQAVSSLELYAVHTGTDLILVGSHGKTGMKRLLLGSFAETLLLQSRVPVMVVGHEARVLYDFKQIFFPTDFSKHAEKVFRIAVALARTIKAKMTLYHSVPSPVEPVFQSGVYLLGGAWVPVFDYFSRETEHRKHHAEAWVRWASHNGVNVELVIEAKGGNLAHSIVRAAKKSHTGLIMMAAKSGPVAATIIGSTTRQVVRSSYCPVWVLRSQILEAGAVLAKARVMRAA